MYFTACRRENGEGGICDRGQKDGGGGGGGSRIDGKVERSSGEMCGKKTEHNKVQKSEAGKHLAKGIQMWISYSKVHGETPERLFSFSAHPSRRDPSSQGWGERGEGKVPFYRPSRFRS